MGGERSSSEADGSLISVFNCRLFDHLDGLGSTGLPSLRIGFGKSGNWGPWYKGGDERLSDIWLGADLGLADGEVIGVTLYGVCCGERSCTEDPGVYDAELLSEETEAPRLRRLLP
jgi:hypothetical protein